MTLIVEGERGLLTASPRRSSARENQEQTADDANQAFHWLDVKTYALWTTLFQEDAFRSPLQPSLPALIAEKQNPLGNESIH